MGAALNDVKYDPDPREPEEPLADLTDAVRLAESLCARICHDLSGSLGAISGMLELLQEAAPAADETLEVASEATASLQHRLELLRAAWGAAPAPLSLDALRSLAAGLPGARRLTLDLDGLACGDFAPEVGRAVLALLMLAAGSLPLGGRIILNGSATDLVVLIEGPKAAWPAELAVMLRDTPRLVAAFDDPRGLALPLAILFARAAGLRLSPLLAAGRGTGAAPLRLAPG